MNLFVTLCLLSLIAGLWLRATPHHAVKADRLLINRADLIIDACQRDRAGAA